MRMSDGMTLNDFQLKMHFTINLRPELDDVERKSADFDSK